MENRIRRIGTQGSGGSRRGEGHYHTIQSAPPEGVGSSWPELPSTMVRPAVSLLVRHAPSTLNCSSFTKGWYPETAEPKTSLKTRPVTAGIGHASRAVFGSVVATLATESKLEGQCGSVDTSVMFASGEICAQARREVER